MADYKPIQVGLDMKNYNAFFFKESHGKSTLKVELCVQQKRPFSFGSFSKEKEEE